jgi:hypothetical protein
MSRTRVRTPKPMIEAFRINEMDRDPLLVVMVGPPLSATIEASSEPYPAC